MCEKGFQPSQESDAVQAGLAIYGEIFFDLFKGNPKAMKQAIELLNSDTNPSSLTLQNIASIQKAQAIFTPSANPKNN